MTGGKNSKEKVIQLFTDAQISFLPLKLNIHFGSFINPAGEHEPKCQHVNRNKVKAQRSSCHIAQKLLPWERNSFYVWIFMF